MTPVDLMKRVINSQLAATLEMAKQIIANCPNEMWSLEINDHVIGRVMYHALFYIDFYYNDLDPSMDNPVEQYQSASMFNDIILPKASVRASEQTLLKQEQLLEFIEHLKNKIKALLADSTEKLLMKQSSFEWLPMTKYETLIYALRHLMEHTAQVNAYLRSNDISIGKWVGTGEL